MQLSGFPLGLKLLHLHLPILFRLLTSTQVGEWERQLRESTQALALGEERLEWIVEGWRMDGKPLRLWRAFCCNDFCLSKATLKCGKGIDGICFIHPPILHELLTWWMTNKPPRSYVALSSEPVCSSIKYWRPCSPYGKREISHGTHSLNSTPRRNFYGSYRNWTAYVKFSPPGQSPSRPWPQSSSHVPWYGHAVHAYKLWIAVSQTPHLQGILQELMYCELVFINFHFRVLVPETMQILTSSWKYKGLSVQKNDIVYLIPAQKAVEILIFQQVYCGLTCLG